jgi:integrase
VSERIGDVPLQALTRQQVKACYAELASGLAPKSVHNVHLCLHKALGAAVEDGLLGSNPADRAHRLPTDRPELAVWTPQETAAFLRSVNGDRLYGLWRLLVATGMRRGEALGLRWADVDLAGGTVAIRRQRVRGPDGIGWGSPKTQAGRRVIDVDPATVAALRAHRAAQDRERLEWGAAYEAGDLLFSRENGAPLDPDSVSGFFERHVRRAGLPRVTLHALRHGHATMMLRQGVPVHVVQRRLGHSNPSVTLSFYAHVLPQQAAEAAARFAALIDVAG